MAHIQLINIVEQKSPDGKIHAFPYAFPVIIKELQETVHTFDLIDTHLHKKTREELLDFTGSCGAKIYGISSYSEGFMYVKSLSRRIREKHEDAVIIVGGFLALSDEVLLKKTDVDIAVTAPEGEFVLPEILDALDEGSGLNTVKGITYKDRVRDRIEKTGRRPPMSKEEFRNKAMPAYEYYDKQIREIVRNKNSMKNVPVKAFPVITTRGCPFSCTFCGHMHEKRMLRKNWERFFDELEFLEERYGIEGFMCYDSNLFFNGRDVDEYCRIYEERKCKFRMIVEMRATFGNYEMFRKMKNHGIDVLFIGVESGSQQMLERMKKGTKIDKVKTFIEDAVKAGLLVSASFIFGTPGENRETIKATRDLMVELEMLFLKQKRHFASRGLPGVSVYDYKFIVPAPASEIYENAVRDGLIPDIEKYLESIDKSRPRAGSIQHSGRTGGNANLTEFVSRKSFVNYVNYSISLVGLHVLTKDKSRLLKNVLKLKIMKAAAKTAALLLRYGCGNIVDRINNEIGRVPDNGGSAGIAIDRTNC